MRIIIYGAGGIGSVVGGHLWRNEQEVVLVGRSGHIGEINYGGLKLVKRYLQFQKTLHQSCVLKTRKLAWSLGTTW